MNKKELRKMIDRMVFENLTHSAASQSSADIIAQADRDVQRNYDFMDRETLRKIIQEIFDDVASKYELPDPSYDTITEYLEDTYGYDWNWVDETTDKTISDMKKYCNQKSTSMVGNMKDISYNYENEFHKDFKDVLAKLNDGIIDDDTDEFRKWSIEWFFEAFGTYNLKYHLNDEISDLLYEEEEDE